MNKLFAIPLFAVILLSGCTTTQPVTTTTSSSVATTSSSQTSASTSSSSSQPPSNVAVTIQSFAFSPGTITIKAGTTVMWTNQDAASHTVTSDSSSELNSGSISTGQSYSHTFAQPGTYTYHCAIHSSMHGTVIVQ